MIPGLVFFFLFFPPALWYQECRRTLNQICSLVSMTDSIFQRFQTVIILLVDRIGMVI